MYNSGTEGATKLVADAADPALHLHTANVALAAEKYGIGFLVGIPGGDEDTDPTDSVVPYCEQDVAANNICSGVPGTPGNVRFRYLRTDAEGVAFFEVWEMVNGTAANYHPGYYVLGSATVYPVALTMYRVIDVEMTGAPPQWEGACEWVGVIANAGAAATTKRETVFLETGTSGLEKIIPLANDAGWSITAKASWLHHPDDYDRAEVFEGENQLVHFAQLHTMVKYDARHIGNVVRLRADDNAWDIDELFHTADRPGIEVPLYIGAMGRKDYQPLMWARESDTEFFLRNPEDLTTGVQDSTHPVRVSDHTNGFNIGMRWTVVPGSAWTYDDEHNSYEHLNGMIHAITMCRVGDPDSIPVWESGFETNDDKPAYDSVNETYAGAITYSTVAPNERLRKAIHTVAAGDGYSVAYGRLSTHGRVNKWHLRFWINVDNFNWAIGRGSRILGCNSHHYITCENRGGTYSLQLTVYDGAWNDTGWVEIGNASGWHQIDLYHENVGVGASIVRFWVDRVLEHDGTAYNVLTDSDGWQPGIYSGCSGDANENGAIWIDGGDNEKMRVWKSEHDPTM